MINNPNSDMKIANGSGTTNSVDTAKSGSIIEMYKEAIPLPPINIPCLLYTSDAADDP